MLFGKSINIKIEIKIMRKHIFSLLCFLIFLSFARLAKAQEGKIISVAFPTEVYVNQESTISILFKNTGTAPATYVVGLTIGREWEYGNFTEAFCNEACYVDDYDTDNYGRKWVEFVINLQPQDSAIATVKFKFRDPVFEYGKRYDVVVRLWKDIRNIEILNFTTDGLDELFLNDAILVTQYPITPGVDAKIVSYSLPTSAMQEQIISVKAIIKNTGTARSDFYVGLSIGSDETGIWCNRYCYADGIGDYFVVRDLEVNSSAIIERKFRIRSEFFEANMYYDARIAVYDKPYVPFEYALDSVALEDYIYVHELVLDAYAFHAAADKTQVGKKSMITITGWIINKGPISYNFTIGMSIGIWDVVSGLKYPYPQYPLIPPCNVECYKDGLGDWVYLYLPPNYTAPVIRVFEVPDYFPLNNSFDVAIGVWKVGGEEPISLVYFKNISYLTYLVPPEQQLKEYGRVGVQEIISFIEYSLNVKREYAKMIFWVIITSVLSISVIAIPAYISKTYPWQLGLIVLLIMTILGAIVRDDAGPFMPYWIVILFVIIGAFIGGKTLYEVFGGGR